MLTALAFAAGCLLGLLCGALVMALLVVNGPDVHAAPPPPPIEDDDLWDLDDEND